MNYLKNTHQEDLVLIFISGGGSSLLPYPVKNVSLTDKITVNKYLLESGANIDEINTVRKHLSQIKGGNLAKFCFPARVHSLILSDVVGDNVSSISSGLTVPDPSTFNDSKNILLKYNLWKKMPKTIINHIKTGIEFKELETPKNGNKIFKNSSYTIIGSNTKSLEEIRRNCIKKDIKCKIWKKNIEGDVREVAKNFVLDLKIKKIKKPMILISGGETTLQVKGSGLGGRNQEFALYFNHFIRKYLPDLKYVFLSAGTDGKDGPTNSAGAIINNESYKKFKEKNINIDKELKNNNSYNVLKQIESLVIINGTNTNVADIQLLLLME